MPGHPKIDPIVEELKRSLIEECDYVREKKNISDFKEMLGTEFPNILIPASNWKARVPSGLYVAMLAGRSQSSQKLAPK